MSLRASHTWSLSRLIAAVRSIATGTERSKPPLAVTDDIASSSPAEIASEPPALLAHSSAMGPPASHLPSRQRLDEIACQMSAERLEPFEKRRSSREKVLMPVRCRTKDGQTGRVILSEISSHGCRLYADEMMLHQGQWITIQPDKMEGMAALVRWVDKKRAGVEFERPLYGAIAEHLQRLYTVPSELSATGIRVVSSSINPLAQPAGRSRPQ